jgi:hypothetical protein
MFLIAIGILYGLTGTLNMADMAVRVAELPPRTRACFAGRRCSAAVGFRAQGGAAAAPPVAAADLRQHFAPGGGAVRDHDQGRRLFHHPVKHAHVRSRGRGGCLGARRMDASGGAADDGDRLCRADRRARPSRPFRFRAHRFDRDAARLRDRCSMRRRLRPRSIICRTRRSPRRRCSLSPIASSGGGRKTAMRWSRAPVHRQRAFVGPVPADCHSNRRASAALGLRRQAADSRGGAAAASAPWVWADDSLHDLRRHRRPCAGRKHLVLEKRGDGRGALASGAVAANRRPCAGRLRFAGAGGADPASPARRWSIWMPRPPSCSILPAISTRSSAREQGDSC